MWFFCTFFLFSSPKTWKSHTYSIFFNRHENGAFLMKNIQNQKYSIIYTFFLQYYGTFRRLNALSSLRTETRKKNMKHLGQPVISHLRIVLLFDLYLQKHSVLIPIRISLWKEPAWEQFVFKEKCQKSKIQYTMNVFVCTPKTYRSHAHLIFFFNRHESGVYLTENVQNQE